jgi:hypothetical protein
MVFVEQRNVAKLFLLMLRPKGYYYFHELISLEKISIQSALSQISFLKNISILFRFPKKPLGSITQPNFDALPCSVSFVCPSHAFLLGTVKVIIIIILIIIIIIIMYEEDSTKLLLL